MRLSQPIDWLSEHARSFWQWAKTHPVSFLKETWTDFNKDNGMLMAAAISFYTFLSIFPLILVGVAVFALILGSPENAERIILGTARGYAVGAQTRDMIHEVIKGRGAATGVGAVLLLWSGTTLIVMMQKAMNVVWDLEQQRGALKQRLLAVVFLVLLGTLLLISVGATALVNYVITSGFPLIPTWSWISTFFSYLIPLLISVSAFTLVYKLLPNTRVRWKVALIGGVFAGVSWEIAKQAFTFYVVEYASYNAVYGSLGGVILLLVWVDYSAIILVLGGEVASIWARNHPQPGYSDAKVEDDEQSADQKSG